MNNQNSIPISLLLVIVNIFTLNSNKIKITNNLKLLASKSKKLNKIIRNPITALVAPILTNSSSIINKDNYNTIMEEEMADKAIITFLDNITKTLVKEGIVNINLDLSSSSIYKRRVITNRREVKSSMKKVKQVVVQELNINEGTVR